GHNDLIGPACDVYALGVILYELLTGRPPFRAEAPLEVLLQVTREEPVPPSRLVFRLPRDLETICLTCLRKDPRKRYGTALDLADDLRRFLSHEPITARPTPAWERAVLWARRRPAMATLYAAIVLTGATLIVGAAVSNAALRQSAERERSAAE